VQPKSKGLHALEHLPQLLRSVCRFTHLSPQAESPALHWMPHMLLMHVAVPAPALGPAHTLPHCPQFLTSFFASTQPAPQGMKEPVHW
jgi:hypothetical protein